MTNLETLASDYVQAEIRYKKAIGAGECNEELHEAVRERDRLFRELARETG